MRRKLLLANGVGVHHRRPADHRRRAANPVFWDSFVAFGMVPMGIVATVVHPVLVVAHIVAWVVSRDPEPA